MFCSPAGSKTKQTSYLTQKNRLTFKNVAKTISTYSLYPYVYINIYMYLQFILLSEKSKKEMEQLAIKGLS